MFQNPLLSAVVAVAAVGGTFIAASAQSPHRTDVVMPPKPVLGSALRIVPVFERLPEFKGNVALAGQTLVPELGRPGHEDLVEAKPVLSLHLVYAHVRPIGGDHWSIEAVASDATRLITSPLLTRPVDAVIDGQAVQIVRVQGSTDGTNIALLNGVQGFTKTEAAKLARTLTTSVTVANCTATEISTNECA